ncbi:MAG: hypothetical protein BECKG1743D_GA0114223_105272, partial [Candidatus Kentron sp. G]
MNYVTVIATQKLDDKDKQVGIFFDRNRLIAMDRPSTRNPTRTYLDMKEKNYVNFPDILGISTYLNDRYWECFKAHDNMYGIYRRKLYPEVNDRYDADRRMRTCCYGSRYFGGSVPHTGRGNRGTSRQ